jgi:hypothetical protein
MILINFSQRFRRPRQNYLGTAEQGEEDFVVLEKLVKETPDGSSVVFDISRFELFGYSYCKQTLRRLLLNSISGFYGNRYFFVVAGSERECEESSVALRERKLAMIGSTSRSPRVFYEKYFVLGELGEPYKTTLDYIIKKRKVTSGQMQRDLQLGSVQAASNRIKKLAGARLVRWQASPTRPRNVLDCTRIEL